MSLNLFDTLGGEKREFIPTDPKRVTLYCCGPTVYSYAHIGNARAAVAADVLFRVLRHEYGADAVVYARNITDIDDKIIACSVEKNIPIGEITEKFSRIYNEDLAALNCLAPTHQPKATESIDDMISIIKTLIEKGFAYAADGHVFFDVSKYEAYGALSGNTLDALRTGDRVGEGEAARKKHAADFVLWKPAQSGVGWPANFGPNCDGSGRPGWHIECSAMIERVLGKTIDIHCGGQDLKFPHHENEIAQSQCAHGVPLANYWVHNGFLQMDSEKMSKSLGNVKLVHELLETWDGEVLRFALLSGLYRCELDWTDDLLQQAKATLDHWYRALAGNPDGGEIDTKFVAALCDDLNSPMALARLSALAKAGNAPSLKASANLLGLLHKDADAWFKGKAQEGGLDDSAIDALIVERAQARADKNWARSDEIRDLFAAENIVLEDGADGTTWRRG